SQRAPRFTAVLPVVAAFVVACIVFAAARHGLVEAPLRTLLAPLAVLLPGALLVTAMAELVTGHMVAGTSRLGYGLVQVLLFTLGILGAARLLPLASADLANVRINDIGWYAAPLGLVLVTLAIALLESPPPRLVPWIFVVLVLAFGAQVAGQALGGAVGGAFLGALVAILGSYAVESVVPRLARLVVFLPSFWLLVPGSLGVLAATQVAVDPTADADVLGVVGIVAAIALGLLLGAAIAQGLGGIARRRSGARRAGD
ncbi:MAG: threonine/serine exporter family protein, partial [Tetrasphaera sp.]|nr:threonine/serine exporter family protein [Tetrasphaera sp.]